MADELIRLDTTIIGIDALINKAETAAEANALFKAKDVIYSQQRYFADAQSVKRGEWKYYKNNGIYDTYKCSICNTQFELPMDADISLSMHYCPDCGAKMTNEKN